MPRYGPTDLVHWIAGYDLAGPGALMEAMDTYTANLADVTPVGPRGGVKHSRPTGTAEYGVTEQGWLDTGQRSLRDLLVSGAPATPWQSIFGYAGDTIGVDVTLATDIRVGKSEVIKSLDDLTKLAVEYYNASGTGVYRFAQLLAYGLVEDLVDLGATPAVAYRLDGAATSSLGAVAGVQVDIGRTRFRGFPNLVLQLRHSNTPGSAWTNLGGATTLTRDSDGAFVVDIASGTDVRRYTALRWTFNGTRDAFQTTAAYSIGDTVLDVDGATGTERIDAGDMVSIGGTDYEVEESEDQGSGSWEITLTSGLTAAVANNVAVTLTGTNTALRYAAALYRR